MAGLRKLSYPATKLMAQLKYSKKISLVFGILLMPLSLSLFFLNAKLATSIDIDEKEIQGLSTYSKIISSMIDSEGEQAKTIAQKAGFKISQQQASEVLEQVSIQSYLAVDNQLSSSYLNRAIVDSLPKLINQTKLTAKQASIVIAAGEFTPDSYIALSNLNKSLPLFSEQLTQKLAVAMRYHDQTQTQLQSHIETIEDALLDFKNQIDTKILQPEKIEMSANEFDDINNETLQSIKQLTSKIIPLLNSQLEDKLSSEQWIYRLVLFASVLSLALAAYLILGFYFSVVDAIKDFSMSVNQAANGDLKIQSKQHGQDEISEMVGLFNTMLQRFSGLVEQAKNTATELGHATTSLIKISEETRQDVSQQQLKITDISELLSEMTSSAHEVENKALEAVSFAHNAGGNVEKGTLNTISLATHMADLQTEFEQSRIALDKLAEDSQNISKVSSAISDIADQTNLLALNAAIEAARAGEQGRGFAVVADEVRTLAKRTQQQTEEIHSIINSLQKASSDTQAKMLTSVEKMDQGVTAANETRNVLSLAEKGMQDIDTNGKAISSLSTNQTRSTEQALRHSEEINELAQHTLISAQTTQQSTEKLTAMAASLQEKMSYFK